MNTFEKKRSSFKCIILLKASTDPSKCNVAYCSNTSINIVHHLNAPTNMCPIDAQPTNSPTSHYEKSLSFILQMYIVYVYNSIDFDPTDCVASLK